MAQSLGAAKGTATELHFRLDYTLSSFHFICLFRASVFLLRLLVTMPFSFDDLPSELKSIVWSYIDYDNPGGPFQQEPISLVPYACVSREWQLAFERLTFRTVVVRSNQLSRFKKHVIAHRMAYLRMLHFIIMVPKCHPNDGVDKRRRDSRALTKNFKDLWSLLRFIEDSSATRQALKLRLRLSAQPSDPRYPFELPDVADNRRSEEPNEFAEMSNLLQFKLMKTPQDLPVISCVDGFV